MNLPKQSVNFDNLVSRFKHLRDLFIENQADAEPTILIGSDNLDLMAPIKSRIGQKGVPVGLRCKLGYYGVQQCDVSMKQSLKNYFTLEEVGVTCPYHVKADEDRRARGIL